MTIGGKIMRIKCHLAITLLLVATLFGTSIMSVSATEVNAYAESSIDKCEEILAFVENNFDTFVDEYNKTVEDEERLNATSIEYSSFVDLLEDDSYGLYIDFNGNNGYAVITSELNIYELETKGDYKSLKNNDLCYSRFDGFVYKDSQGIYQKVFTENHSGLNMSPYRNDNVADSSAAYPGQSAAGDGEIESAKIGEYISARYPDYTYKDKRENLASDFDFARQTNTSYYVKKECEADGTDLDGTFWSEGNCALNAMFNIMRNWSKKSKISSIAHSATTDIRTTITSDVLYPEWGSYIVRTTTSSSGGAKSGGDEIVGYYYWRPNYSTSLRVMPNLYTNIRAYAISQYGYTPESGYYASNVPDTLEYVARTNYGITIDVTHTSTISTAISSLDSGKAVYLSINNSSTYGNHGVALIGYQEYSYTTGWWIFSQTHYVYFYQVADGWNDTAMYFDPNTDAAPSISFCVLN